jgi:protein TonB
MKKIFFTLIALAFILTAKAQTSDAAKPSETDTMVYVPHKIPGDSTLFTPPDYPGGRNKFIHFLAHTVRYPAVAREKNEQGKVMLQMIVEKDGSISNLKVITHVSASLDAEAFRVTKLMPKWMPGTYNGAPVRTLWTFPMSFTLSTD